MTRLSTALHNDLQLLKLLRDELVLKAHLLKAEAKVEWEALEIKSAELKAHVARAEVAAGHARQDAETAITLLVDTVKTGYASIRSALKS